MAKVALLIGVSQYQGGFSPLPKAKQDVEAMQKALQDQVVEGFDPIQVLLDPDVQTMRVKIETLFSGCSKEDLLVLFFSGHGIKDDRGKLYFTSQDTRKSTSGELIRATAVAASFVQELMSQSRCKRQVVILDCCFSGAFAAGMAAKDSGMVDIETQLGGEGRVVLTSSTSTQYSFEEQSADLSIYTRYLVEGLETGAADLNHDGWIEVEELHEYAKNKVQATAPAMKPEIYAVKEGFKIRLLQARIGDPKLRYRQEAERYANRGEIGGVGRMILDTLRDQLGMSAEEAAQIEDELLRPYQERLENLERYREAILTAIELGYPFSEETRSDLNHFQDLLGLRDEDVAPIETEIVNSIGSSSTYSTDLEAIPETTPPPLSNRASPQSSPEAHPQSPSVQEHLEVFPDSKPAHKIPFWKRKTLTAMAVSLIVGIGYVSYIIVTSTQPSEQEGLSTAEIVKDAWLGLVNSTDWPPASASDACDIGIWTQGTSMRGLYCRLQPAIDFQILQNIAPAPIFVKGPHGDSLNLNANDFGYYNPEFVRWVRANFNPGAKDPEFRERTQIIYDRYVRYTARVYYGAHKVLFANTQEFEDFREKYQRIKADYSERSGRGEVRQGGMFKTEPYSNPQSFEAIKSEYLAHIENGTLPNIYHSRKFDWLADYLSVTYYEGNRELYLVADGKSWSLAWYPAARAGGFWLRRSIDGTEQEFFALLEDLLNTYDSEFIRSLNNEGM